MYYYDDYDSLVSTTDKLAGTAIWAIIAFVIAIAAGIMIYFMFIKNSKKFDKKLETLRSILDFKVMLVEPILKITYLCLTVFIILFSFSLISYSFVSFLLVLIFGPLLVRITYEFSLILVMIWKNTKEINENLKGKNSKKVETKKEEK